MKVGDTITFKPEYSDPGDADIRFIVVEVISPERIRVEAQIDVPIKPTQVVAVDMIESVKESN